ncbi:MAG: sulfite exporter TauE/SafE family protein [Oscillospiraceae bacterium]|nr:sulfite exporter TauE/SafE family protein [Oscillospiraceae bacterium]
MLRSILAGGAAGAVNGLFGAGGGMVLVPLLSGSPGYSEEEVFASSILIILPICVVSLVISAGGQLPWAQGWPYLLGGVPGGILAATFGKRIPTAWLHRFLGALILYGGVRYLW